VLHTDNHKAMWATTFTMREFSLKYLLGQIQRVRPVCSVMVNYFTDLPGCLEGSRSVSTLRLVKSKVKRIYRQIFYI
jgi:hypothetical protein